MNKTFRPTLPSGVSTFRVNCGRETIFCQVYVIAKQAYYAHTDTALVVLFIVLPALYTVYVCKRKRGKLSSTCFLKKLAALAALRCMSFVLMLNWENQIKKRTNTINLKNLKKRWGFRGLFGIYRIKKTIQSMQTNFTKYDTIHPTNILYRYTLWALDSIYIRSDILYTPRTVL